MPAIKGKLHIQKTSKLYMVIDLAKKGDIVVMDNFSDHKVAGVQKAIRVLGARVLYQPPYSPDFNLIEMVFAKLKTLVRKAK
jgi:transposase